MGFSEKVFRINKKAHRVMGYGVRLCLAFGSPACLFLVPFSVDFLFLFLLFILPQCFPRRDYGYSCNQNRGFVFHEFLLMYNLVT